MTDSLMRYEPLDPATIADPFPTYAALRRNHPMYWHEGMNSWVLSRYDDCHRILKDADLFARDIRRVDRDLPSFRQTIQSLDPPENKNLRSSFVRAFREQDLARLGERLRDSMDAIVATTTPGRPFDYVSTVARPMALEASSAILGVSPPDGELIAELSAAIARRMDSGLDTSRTGDGDAARHRLNDLIRGWMADGSEGGVLSAFAGGADPDHYVLNTVGVIFNASYSTVLASLGTTMDALLDMPPAEWDASIVEHGDLAADELIRFAGPTQGTSRWVTRDTTVLHGQTVRRGEMVVALVAAANRDDSIFADPEVLNLARTPNRHLGFGFGAHSCFGSPLGKQSIVAVHAALLRHGLAITRAGATNWHLSATLRSAREIPVVTTPRRPGR